MWKSFVFVGSENTILEIFLNVLVDLENFQSSIL